jgi:hypothetical protein
MSPLIVTAALSILAAAAAPAQPSPPPITVAPVTVQAPLTPPEALKKSEGFVKTYAAVSPTIGQLSSWHDPLCVMVTGLTPDQSAAVKARIEEVGVAVGLEIKPPGCKANIEVVFTGKPQDLLDWVARHSDEALGYHFPAQLKTLQTISRPVQSWYMTATRGGDSDNGSLAFAITKCIGGCGTAGIAGGVGLRGAHAPPESVDMPGGARPNGCGGSHFTVCLSSVFHNVLVVADARRVQGQPLGPLSDYLAMLALSQPRSLDGCLALSSIIDLYASAPCPDRAPPDGLTAADAAFLTSLYATDAEQKQQSFDVAERMARIVVNANPKQEDKP